MTVNTTGQEYISDINRDIFFAITSNTIAHLYYDGTEDSLFGMRGKVGRKGKRTAQ
jgi:hypothetical protein